jgi:hypothetical protein
MTQAIASILGALLLAATTSLQAQGPSSEPAKPRTERRFDCSKAPDPKACEERRAKSREAVRKARAACEGKRGDERRDCLRQQACAQAKDPAACEARAKEQAKRREQRTEARQKAHEACAGKRGEELRSCLREQYPRKK